MTILTRQQLMEQRNLTACFIRKHDREMGGRGKPRRYDLSLVDYFLYRYFREEQARSQATEHSVEKLISDIDKYVSSTRTAQDGPRQMVGRGGRTAA